MTISRIDLESFEADGAREPYQSADYARGFEAGVAHAQDGYAALQQEALSEIRSRLNDMTFGYTEARIHLLDQIRPLLAQIAETVLPDVLHQTFAEHLIQTLQQSFTNTTEEPVNIHVSADVIENFTTSRIAENTQFTFVKDDTVTPGQAILKQSETHIMIDFLALLDALQAALLGLEASERTADHG